MTRLRVLLSDGEWHSMAELYEQAAYLVSPQQAAQRVLRCLQADQRHAGQAVSTDLDEQVDLERVVFRGRRIALQNTLLQMRCERDGTGYWPRYRRPMDLPLCAHCTQPFWPSRRGVVYCGKRCGSLATRTKQQAGVHGSD